MKQPIIIIKLGTSSIVHEKTHQPLLSTLAVIVETATSLRKDGYRVVIVSSGAIGMALQQMNLSKRPKHLPQVQALAAIGQCRLMGLFDQLFERLGQPVAQILLTRNDIADRTQYLNAQNTFFELLSMGVIPIVNENDTLSVSEIKFGDNDTLSAITAGMVQADYLFLMTDVDCLYDKNPRTFPDAKAIEVVENIAELEADVSSAGSALGTGGMSTKIVAARLATAAGVTTIITRSSKPGNVAGIVAHIEAQKAAQRARPSGVHGGGDANETPAMSSSQVLIPPAPLHTRFLPSSQPIGDRRFWLLHGLSIHGTIYVDAGAAKALAHKAGLLPAGVVDVEGMFGQQECVRLVGVSRRNSTVASSIPSHVPSLPATPLRTPSSSGHVAAGWVSSPYAQDVSAKELGRALVNYSASEIRLIAGLRSTEIAHVLGYADSEYVALRENVAMLGMGEKIGRPVSPTPTISGIDTIPSRLGSGLAGYVEG